MTYQKTKKVLVALSGGVDSAVAAALLKKKGYYVMGGFMKTFSPENWEGVIQQECPWEKDQQDAQAVCKKLGIPFRSFHFEREYEQEILNNFFQEYQSGRTPNPDVLCNEKIKFGIFLQTAVQQGFDFIATGHYARIQNGWLLKGIDKNKDQSYFLYRLSKQQLRRTLFPIGELTKTQVRRLAKKWGLPNAEKKDSQGLCFIGNIRLRKFLRKKIPDKKGYIQDISGKIIGEHHGVWPYTIGQRKGIGIGGSQKPYYVVSRDVRKNALVVAQGRNNDSLYSQTIYLRYIHWINHTPQLPLDCSAKIRYRQEDQRCHIEYIENQEYYRVDFEEKQFACAAGQSCVFYDGDRVLGGGIIDETCPIG